MTTAIRRPTDAHALPNGSFVAPQNGHELRLQQQLAQIMEHCDEQMAAPDFDLPMLPGVVLEILEMLREEDVNVDKLCSTIQMDAGMSAKILKIANSAFYGGTQRTATIQDSVIRIGLLQIRDLVISVGLKDTLFKDERLKIVAQRLWGHSVQCAVVADHLVKNSEGEQVAVFLPALLHDIGQIPSLLFLFQEVKDFSEVRPEFILSEIDRYHVRAGVTLMQHWHMPMEVALAVGAHHAPLQKPSSMSSQVLLRFREVPQEERDKLARCLSAVVLADHLLAYMDHSDEIADGNPLSSPVALEFGITETDREKFRPALEIVLRKAPHLINL